MTDPFVAVLVVLFASPLAVDAVYQPAGGDPIPLRVIVTRASPRVGTGNGEFIVNGTTIEMPMTVTLAGGEILLLNPSEGEAITIGAEHLTIMGEPATDAEGLSWLFEAAA